MILERETPHGLLRYEDWKAGEWTTQAGTPAKKPKREYTLNGVKFDSVSSVVDTLSKPALVDWAGNLAAVDATAAALRGDLAGVPPEEIVERLASLGLGHKAAQEEGAARGNAVHTAFDTLAATGHPPVLADHPEDWRGYLMGAARVWLALNAEPIEHEQIVCHPDYGYAGRFDLLARTHRGRTLIDYKSAKGGRVYPEAHYQARLYAEAMTACDMLAVDAVVIVAIGPDGAFEVIDCAAEWEDAEALHRTFLSRKRINAAMAEQRKIARAAAKAAA